MLRMAVKCGNVLAAKQAVKDGADVNQYHLYSISLIYSASQDGDWPMTQFLLEKGANEEDIVWNNFTARDIAKWTNKKHRGKSSQKS